MTPIALTDEQLSAVMRAAAPLLPQDRSAFLEDLARELTALPDIGDGVLHRTIASVQRKHWSPPRETGHNATPRHGSSKLRQLD
jgi:hypothetical protein